SCGMLVSLYDTAAVYSVIFQSVDHKLSEIVAAYTSDKYRTAAKPGRGVNADGRGSAGIGAFEGSGLPQRDIFFVAHDLYQDLSHNQKVCPDLLVFRERNISDIFIGAETVPVSCIRRT